MFVDERSIYNNSLDLFDKLTNKRQTNMQDRFIAHFKKEKELIDILTSFDVYTIEILTRF